MGNIDSKTSTKRLCKRLNAGDCSQELMYLLHKRMWKWIVSQYKLKRYIHPIYLKADWVNLYAPAAAEELENDHSCFLCKYQTGKAHASDQSGLNKYSPSDAICATCPLGSCIHRDSLYFNLSEMIRKGKTSQVVKYAQKILNCV